MTIYEVAHDSLRKVAETSFAEAGIKERSDLQRLLRSNIAVVAPDTLVIAEEFGEWQESKRRIDLLGIAKDGNLVIVELKRDDDGGHMELQAIRYAAMVSTMTFEKAVEVYADHLSKSGSQINARQSLLDHLGWDDANEDGFAQDVRIVLVSADFSKELTTAVMWLNERDLDIRCIRMKPYQDGPKTLVDVQQVIPLPEAADYQVQIRQKERQERQERAERYLVRKRFWISLLHCARDKTDLHTNISPSEVGWIGAGAGVSGLALNYVVKQHQAVVELYIDRGPGIDSKEWYDSFFAAKESIEREFGQPLSWQRLDDKRACRIAFVIEGGYRDDEQLWPKTQEAMVDAMIRLEKALRPYIGQLKAKG